MLRRLGRIGLIGKIFGVMLALAILANITLVYCLSSWQAAATHESILARNWMLAHTAAKNVATGMTSREEMPYDMLKSLADSPNIARWLIVQPDGTIYASNDYTCWGEPIHRLYATAKIPAPICQDTTIALPQSREDLFVVPIEKGHPKNPYTFWLDVRRNEADAAWLRIFVSNVTVTCCSLIALAAAFYFFLNRLLSRSLRQLTKGNDAVAAGNLDYRLDINSDDELGQLAESFNKMAEDLQSTTVSRAYLDGIIRMVPNALIVLGPGGVIREVNRAACRLLEWSEEEIIGLDCGRIFPALVRHDAEASLWDRLLDAGQFHDVETECRVKTGRSIPVLLSASAMVPAQGAASPVVLAAVDITQRKQAEEESRLHQQRLSRLTNTLTELTTSGILNAGDLPEAFRAITESAAKALDVARVGVWFFTDDGTSIRCADIFDRRENSHCYSAELLVKEFPGYFNALRTSRAIVANDAQNDPCTAEFTEAYLRPNGITSILDAPFRLANGLKGIVCCEHGGPPRVWLHEEESFVSSVADILSLVVESFRRRQVEAQLILAKEIAEEANAAKSSFLAHMSHEVRTPMTAILGYAELAAEPGAAPETVQGYLGIIRHSGEHLLGVINDILDISKIEAGKLELAPMPCDAHTLFENVVHMLRARAEDKHLTLSVRYATPIPRRIVVDEGRLRQCLVNLVANALKFTEQGGVTIEASLRHDWRPATPALEIRVIDTGIGIDPGALDHLFQPFSQADASTSRKYGGTGLGLVITQRVIELMGGELAVASVLGQGSTFTLYVPTGPIDGVSLVDPSKDAAARPAPAEAAAAFASDILQGVQILLAEDGPENQRLFRTILAKVGAEVHIVDNGVKAVQEALDRPFDVILMDMQMPELDGYGATQALRMHGYRRPVIALTASSLLADRERCLSAGCTDYISKPVDRKTLLETVLRHLQGRDASAAPTGQTTPS